MYFGLERVTETTVVAPEIVRALTRIRRVMLRVVDRLFPSARLRYEACQIVKRAREVANTNRIVRIRSVNSNAYRAIVLSTRREPITRVFIPSIRSGYIALERGDYESIHFIDISPNMMRCTCLYSVYLSARADNTLQKLGVSMNPIAYRYTLCKHVVAVLATLLTYRAIDLREPWVRRGLIRGIAVLYLATESMDRIARCRDLVVERIRRILELPNYASGSN